MIKQLLTLSIILISSANARSFSIYGDDNRMDVYASQNPLFKKIALSTAALIKNHKLKKGLFNYKLDTATLKNQDMLCDGERFLNQPAAATCSGTLVAPDIIMTAGHCYFQVQKTCENMSWVFDYRLSGPKQKNIKIAKKNVYRCKEVLVKELDISVGIDYALIKLDRPVKDREPIKLRSSGDIEVNVTPLVLIGHPRGLPTKIAADGVALQMEENHFLTNLDAFTSNSGSGVFNAITGEVEGILSFGNEDYTPKNDCFTSAVYAPDQGVEGVIKVRKVQEYLDSIK